MPMDRSRYPEDWDEISRRIRDRAGNRCEWCGVENRIWIVRSNIDSERYLIWDPLGECTYTTPDGEWIRLSEIPDEFEGEPIRITLTVAHLGVDHADGTPGDKHDKFDCRPENLAALCQRCHLNFDRDDHIENRRRNRLARIEAETAEAGQLRLRGF